MEQGQSPFEEFRAQAQPIEYAGFWLRFVAFIIDVFIFYALFIILTFIIGFFGALLDNENPSNHIQAFLLIIYAIFIVAFWLYFAIMESSVKQATLGKMALKLKVTDLNGNRISFGQASGRHFSKIVSGVVLYIGYIMAAFTEKKQALHDMMTDCLVVKANPNAVVFGTDKETY